MNFLFEELSKKDSSKIIFFKYSFIVFIRKFFFFFSLSLTVVMCQVFVLRRVSLGPIRKCRTFCKGSPPLGCFPCKSEKR